MKKINLSLLLGLIMWTNVKAQNVNFSEHIAPIIYNHCTSCHRPGEVGPFSLTNYNEVYSWGEMIEYVTTLKYMPPWKPDPNYRHFQRENFLTDAEIQKIADWVNAGKPQGNPALEPPLPNFPIGSQVGQPDLVLSFAKKYKHVGNNLDEYRYFVIPTGLTQNKDLIGLEVRPGNTKIAHHALLWEDTTGTAAAIDAQDTIYGYETGANNSTSLLNGQLPGYVPGMRPVLYQFGMAQKLRSGSDITIQMHYAPTPVDEFDSTTINLFFAPQSATRYIKSKVMVPLPGTLTNGPFFIPANQIKEFHGTYTFNEKVSLLNIAPHMHLLGVSWRVFAMTPQGDTAKLIRINEWDFNWQGSYSFKQPVVLPAGSVIHAYAKYNNTSNNIHNPNNPPIGVTWGENTSDEMYYLPFSWVSYQAGDENLVFESGTTNIFKNDIYTLKNKLYPIAPNPAKGNIKLGFSIVEKGNVSIKIFDLSGKLVAEPISSKLYFEGLHYYDFDASGLTNGIYNVNLQINGKQSMQKLMILD